MTTLLRPYSPGHEKVLSSIDEADEFEAGDYVPRRHRERWPRGRIYAAVALLLLLLALGAVLVLGRRPTLPLRSNIAKSVTGTDVATTHGQIYLVMGANGTKLTEHAILATPHSDVILLCFAAPCTDSWPGDTSDDRFEFAYYPHSTWTEARNRLYALAQRREQRLSRTYRYYTFLDGDFLPALDLDRPAAKAFSQVDSSPRAAWNHYEQILDQYLPAVATPRAVPWGTVPFGSEDITISEYADAICNSVHRLAAPLLLPYATNFDEWSWYASQAVLLYRSRCVYGSLFQLNGIVSRADAPNEHASYPQAPPFPLAWSRIDDYLPKALHAIGQNRPPDGNGAHGALSPIVYPRVDWYAAIPDECFAITLATMEAKGYD